ncbi:TetR family transcriptional regulator [Arthrobacter sp. efr-133-TYG-118]|uniref:TetR/AcrR family transcriptional regulator n=1 Tax=Arthrobacter sp. efr-133-TYG-118 TaxID=3040279 RepID=UPI00254F64F6|nr:TetR family transcriptional regulator [Arthrobacter sp. efr-133-TYG-118]
MSQDNVQGEGLAEDFAQTGAEGERRTPRRRNSVRTQAEILRAAGELFARWGYSHVTLQDIAQRVGVTPALIVRYFGSKRHLFGEVAQMPSTTTLRQHSLDAKRVARDLLTFWREDESRLAAFALVRSLEFDDGELFRQAMADRIFGPWSAALPGDDVEMRARLLGGVLMGYGFFSTNALMNPDSAAPSLADEERVLIYLERIIDACLTPLTDDDSPGGG